ncbi:hypothetical protein SAMN05446935_7654 [Burkholderia sp. YR290]|nr:hypothetical protein SAMN05446935_7654 [Burkholderia sp. YR290]
MNHRERMRRRRGAQILEHLGNGSLPAVLLQQYIDLRIDQLIVEGLQSSDAYQFGNAVQTELTRLLVERGIQQRATSPLEFARLAAGAISVTSASKPVTTGWQVAEAVYSSFTQIRSVGGNSPSAANSRKRGGAA